MNTRSIVKSLGAALTLFLLALVFTVPLATPAVASAHVKLIPAMAPTSELSVNLDLAVSPDAFVLTASDPASDLPVFLKVVPSLPASPPRLHPPYLRESYNLSKDYAVHLRQSLPLDLTILNLANTPNAPDGGGGPSKAIL